MREYEAHSLLITTQYTLDYIFNISCMRKM